MRNKRIQEKTVRILKLIDAMACFRHPKTAIELSHDIDSRVCLRSLTRDLSVLIDLGLVFEQRRPARSGPGMKTYKLDLQRSERLQRVANHVVDVTQ